MCWKFRWCAGCAGKWKNLYHPPEMRGSLSADFPQVGDNVLDYNPQFMFYITTKLSNPHYTPEVSTKTTIVSWFLACFFAQKGHCIALRFLRFALIHWSKSNSVCCKCRRCRLAMGNCLLGELHCGVGWSDQPAPWCHRPQRRSSFGGRQESLALPSCKRLHDCIKSPRVRWSFILLFFFDLFYLLLFSCFAIYYSDCDCQTNLWRLSMDNFQHYCFHWTSMSIVASLNNPWTQTIFLEIFKVAWYVQLRLGMAQLRSESLGRAGEWDSSAVGRDQGETRGMMERWWTCWNRRSKKSYSS